MVYNTAQPPPPHPHPQSHTVCLVLYVYLGRGGGQREVEGQQYTSKVPSSVGATVQKLGRKYQPWVFPVYKINKKHAAKSVNRSILKKADI